MLKKVISGGQDGADVAGLRAAKFSGLKTGGMMPRNCMTISGLNRERAALFSMSEHYSGKYPPRTEANVVGSDATIRLAQNFMTAGERCTLKFILAHDKPWFDVKIHEMLDIQTDPREVAQWIDEENIETLNVAGNGKEEIENCVQEFLEEVFRLAKG